MQRITTSTKAADLFGAGKDGFRNGDLANAIVPTDFNAEWCNQLQEELANIVEGAGLALSGAAYTQVRQAVKRLFGGNVTTVNFAASPFDVTADHAGLILVDATAGNVVLNLPAVNVIAGKIDYRFVRTDATASTVTVNRAGADTFVGATTSFTLTGQGDYRAISGDSAALWATTAAPTAPSPAGRNLLINGNFNINQRGYVSGVATVGANEYTLDRWRVVTLGQSLVYAASGNGNIVTAPAGGIEQVIEGALIGDTVGVINWVGTATCTVDGVAKVKGATFVLVPGTNCTVKFSAGTVSKAQLELGTVVSPFEFRPPQAEMLLCVRYYRKKNWWMQAASGGGANGVAWEFLPPMRATPTVASSNVTVGSAPSFGTITSQQVDWTAGYNGNGQNRFDITATAEL